MKKHEQAIDPLGGGQISQASPKQVRHEVASSEILRGENEVLIRHGDDVYRLKLTRNGKLILQK